MEDESGNDASPNSLKSQIEAYLGEPATRLLLNDKIDGGAILVPRGYPNDIDLITDLPSVTAIDSLYVSEFDGAGDVTNCVIYPPIDTVNSPTAILFTLVVS